jgi:hypothetical protein
MFQMYPGALDAELDRRHELAAATMHAVHGTTMNGRVAGIARFRHVVATLVIGAVAFIR